MRLNQALQPTAQTVYEEVEGRMEQMVMRDIEGKGLREKGD
jgi:hypothetical protein